MKNASRMIVFFLVILLFVSNSLPFVSAAVIDEPQAETFSIPGGQNYLTDRYGNQYSTRTFATCDAAHRAYGWDRTFYDCDVTYGGNHYNFFYNYADGTKQYFYVSG